MLEFKKTLFRKKMEEHNIAESRIRQFLESLDVLASGQTGLIREGEIQPTEEIPTYEQLSSAEAPLGQVAILKLNGGLGTSMGLDKPKSLLPVKKGNTFLDIVVKQTLSLGEKLGRPVPLLLMNSFSTSQATLEVLASYPELQQDLPFEFLQSKVPKIDQEKGEPVTWESDPDLEWCPPGHGGIYLSMLESGIARKLLERGIRYVFVSNIDNLGATMDPKILAYFANSDAPFLMEVTARTPDDKKGGHLAKSKSGSLLLREVAQCPPEDLEQFQDIQRYRYFNTNNLWLNLEKIFDQLSEVSLPLIVNRKTVDPADSESPAVIQLESAMGAAISFFEGAKAICVPRSRFVPVKRTSDLLLVRSSAFDLDDNYVLQPTTEKLPTVSLSPEYKLVQDFEARIPAELDLEDCEALSLQGDISLEPETKIVGSVHLEAPVGESVTHGGVISS